MSENRCVMCGEIIPEERRVCPTCERKECSWNGYKVAMGGAEISPHDYVLDERIENCTVEILRCKKCGKLSIGWYRNE